MSERVTRANLEQRADNVNRRLRHTDRFVVVQGRNGYIGLDEYERMPNFQGRTRADQMVRTLTVGTKREVGDFLHAMMVGIDLARPHR